MIGFARHRLLIISAVFSCLSSSVRAAGLSDLPNCDPLKKDHRCPPDPAFARNRTFDFVTSDWNAILTDFWTLDKDTQNDHSRLQFIHDGEGTRIMLQQGKEAPTLTSNKYIFFGRVTAEIKAASGRGVVTTFSLMSDNGNEIDWELLGAYEKQAQSNYYYDGQALFDTYNETYTLDSSSYDAYHSYSIDWTPSSLVFSIDGAPVSTLRKGTIPLDKWPQLPMQIKIGAWAVTNNSDKGEIGWAGGLPEWSIAATPYVYVRTVEVQDYMGGCEEIRPGVSTVEYSYDERTHGWQEVDVVGCQRRLVDGKTVTDSPSSPTRGIEGSPQETAAMGEHGSSGNNSDNSGGRINGGGASGGDNDEGTAGRNNMLSSTMAVLVFVGWLLIL